MTKPRVTITLGRSGQRVVKESRRDCAIGRANTGFLSGSKRSSDESFVCSTDHSLKRMREVGSERNYQYPGQNDDSRLGPQDLRLKLMQKRRKEHEIQERKVELHEKVSRAIRSMESPESSLLRNIPSSRGTGEPPEIDSIRSSYTYQATNAVRLGSMDRISNYPSGFSTPKSIVDELRRGPLVSSYNYQATNGVRPGSSDRVANYPSGFSTPKSIVVELPRGPFVRPMAESRTGHVFNLISNPLDSSTLRAPIPTPVDSSKLVMNPPSGGGISRLPIPAGQPLSVSSFLNSLGLGKYAINFQAEEIDMVALKQMGELDLKELGIPMGPRKKILLALQPRPKRVTEL